MKKHIYSLTLLFFVCNFAAAQIEPPVTVANNCGLTIADVDIFNTGTFIGAADDAEFPVTLPFPFAFPGESATTDILVSTNGYFSNDITVAGNDLSNDCPIPSPPSTGAGARLYPLHDDLVVDIGVFVEAVNIPHPNGVVADAFVVYYSGVTQFGSTASFDFAVVLWSNNDFAFIYVVSFTHLTLPRILLV